MQSQHGIDRHSSGIFPSGNSDGQNVVDEIKHIPAANFKAECLRLLDEVAQRRHPIIVTKRGKPVAKLVPVDDLPIDPFGCMAGTAKICGDIISPIEDAGWTGDAENI
jgi:prevent-host-death family protein